jgi:hypothetical protein
LNEVLEQLKVDVKPKMGEKLPEEVNIPIDYEVVSLWYKEADEKHLRADVRVDFIDPTGKVLKSFPQPVEMPKEMRRLRTRFRIAGLGLTVPGDYLFVVSVKESGVKDFRRVSELPLEVHINRSTAATSKN